MFTRLLFLFFCALLAACSYTIKVKDGRTAYERKQYASAVPMLEKEFAKSKVRSEKGKLAFMIGDSWRHQGKDDKSLEWFKMAYDNNFGPEALKGYAYALKKLERYAEARESFKNLGIEIGSPYEYRREITACNVAESWLKEQKDNGYAITTTAFNSPQNDFSPIFAPDGRLIFSSDRAMAKGEDKYRWTDNKFMDLFIVEPDGASPQTFDLQLNTPGNEGTVAINAKGNLLFFSHSAGAYKGDDAFCKIYFSQKIDDGAWGDPVPLPFQKEKINYVHPALSPDGKTLYYACNDPEGWGGYDLYAVQMNLNNETGWDEPKILSRSVNTPYNELFPVFSADTLYFASDGHTGMGGLDVYATYRTERNAWAPPQNLKAPINSGADDFGLIVQPLKNVYPPKQPGDLIRAGFFTSNRAGGRGADDIYRFEQKVPPPKPVKKDTTPAKPLVHKIVLEGYVLEKIFATADNPNTAVLGRRPLEGASVVAEFGAKKQRFTVGANGFFRMELEENMDYVFNATKSNYLSNSGKFSTRGIAKNPAQPEQVFEIEIVLDKIYVNQEIVLENIYYDYDKWDIRPDAEPTLNKLAETLRQNPEIRIQLGSHTDCRGNNSYNENLSQRRAQSAVNYLISKGIDPARLSALGYGESQPALSCVCTRCTESEHQTNRRTTFKVIE